jgi:hypothetical protein
MFSQRNNPYCELLSNFLKGKWLIPNKQGEKSCFFTIYFALPLKAKIP